MIINLKYRKEMVAQVRGNTAATKTSQSAEAVKANAPTLCTAIATPKFFFCNYGSTYPILDS